MMNRRFFRAETNRRLWINSVRKYGPVLFFARSPTPSHAVGLFPAPSPPKVDHLFSAVLQEGVRFWAFSSASQRDKFVADFGEAQPCENPL